MLFSLSDHAEYTRDFPLARKKYAFAQHCFSLTDTHPLVINGLRFAQIAQSVEQRTENPRVGSSILSLGTTDSKRVTVFAVTLFCLPLTLLSK